MTIKDKINSYKEELNMFDDNIEKYQYIMEKGKSVGTTLADDLKNDTFKVQGCQSQVWLVPIRDGEVINYSSDSDAFITKGVVSIIAVSYTHLTLPTILLV